MTTGIIDTHIHLDVDDYRDDLHEVIARAKDADVTKVFIPAIDESSGDAALLLAQRYPNYAFAMMGLHPEEVKADYAEVLRHMKKRFDESHSFIAVGEVGLDFYWSREFEQQQLEAFEEQVRWSIEYDLPLMIHCRKGQNEMVHILKKYKSQLPGGVFHCFTGNEHEADAFLQFDKFVLGIGGVLTFKKSNLPSVLPHIPLSRIVLETDGPYMAPVPMRGKRNESAYLTHVVEKMAETYATTSDEIARQTSENVKRVFGKRVPF
ncbi:MAG: TatD family hydrolase [Hoylesella shahii]|uniref:TatD family hydrolase n=1 Tax=Hoylesella shahii TaxID=228603 RepID=UPI003F9F4A3D